MTLQIIVIRLEDLSCCSHDIHVPVVGEDLGRRGRSLDGGHGGSLWIILLLDDAVRSRQVELGLVLLVAAALLRVATARVATAGARGERRGAMGLGGVVLVLVAATLVLAVCGCDRGLCGLRPMASREALDFSGLGLGVLRCGGFSGL